MEEFHRSHPWSKIWTWTKCARTQICAAKSTPPAAGSTSATERRSGPRRGMRVGLDLTYCLSKGSSKHAVVDRDRLFGDQPAVIGGEEQREIGDVLRRDQVGQALRGACRLDLRFGLKPQLALALGEHSAGRDRVDPDAVRPQRPGERIGETNDRCLGRGI